jgi:MFS family permease
MRTDSRSATVWVPFYTLTMLAAINACNYVDRAALAMLLPMLQRDLRLTDTALGLLSGMPFAICYAVCCLPAAHLADRYSRRNLIALGFIFWSAVTTASAAVTSGMQLAVARLLLGAGESTGLPASTSLLADLFPSERRSIAYAVMAASPNIGLLLGFPLVAWVMHAYGWRAAFLAAGVPGLFLALIFYISVREPVRTNLVGTVVPVTRAGFGASLRFLAGSRAYVLVLVGGALYSVGAGAMLSWAPSFLVRVHKLTPADIGFYFGTMRGVAGLAGGLSAGFLVSALARRNTSWFVWVPAAAELLLFPADALFLLGNTPGLWRSGLVLDAVLNAFQVATTYTLLVGVARANMRAVATALYLIVCSLIGLACGPAVVGIVNDALAHRFGVTAIRYSLLVVICAYMAAGLATMAAGRHWRRDALRAAQADTPSDLADSRLATSYE